MKILLLTDDYLPESTKNHARMLHDLALSLSSRNHSVFVLSPDFYRNNKPGGQPSIDGISIWRFPTYDYRGKGRIIRGIGELLLPFQAFIWLVRTARLRQLGMFDICVSYSPTIFWGPISLLLKLKGVFVFLILRDFFPQWLVDRGLLNKWSPIYGFFKLFERLNYAVSDYVALQSENNIEPFLKLYNRPEKVRVMYNWTSHPPAQAGKGGQAEAEIKTELGLQEKVVYFYGGNIGRAQDIETLARLAKALSSDLNAHFLFVGSGDRFEFLDQYKKINRLANITIIPAVSQSEYDRLLMVADIGLFSLAGAHSAHNIPGKLLGYIRTGLPILGSVNQGNDVIDVIHRHEAGLVSTAGDFDELMLNARALLDEGTRRKLAIGSSGLVDLFSTERAVHTILDCHGGNGEC